MTERYAYCPDDVVIELFNLPPPVMIDEVEHVFTLADVRHADYATLCRPCGPDVAEGWRWTGSGFAAPAAPEPAPLSAAELIAYAADRRWRRETGGIVIGGIPVATDDRSKIMVLGARIAARADPEWTTVWHGADGGTYPLNAAAMLAISNAIEAHVNGTFATFAIVKAGIEAGETTTIAEIDAAFEV